MTVWDALVRDLGEQPRRVEVSWPVTRLAAAGGHIAWPVTR